MFSNMKPISFLLTVCSLFLLTGASSHAEEPVEASDPVIERQESQKMANDLEQPAKHMSPVTAAPAAMTLVENSQYQAANTAMAPGICLVVDEIVRQYCSTNPDDISCQFQ
jgi:uncharacterized protein YcfL